MMARQIAARGRLCAGEGWPGVSDSRAARARCTASLRPRPPSPAPACAAAPVCAACRVRRLSVVVTPSRAGRLPLACYARAA
jgi:hypothetical protein